MWLVLSLTVQAEDDFQYNPIGKRDPFQTFRVGLPPAPDTGLTAWEIDELRLVGIVDGLGPERAMLIDPDGGSWIVEVGDYVGRAWGQVVEIDDDSIHLREEYLDITGDGLVVKPYQITFEH
ncbi:MAG: pilus assembly protein PilP [Proteobacteria bacterium]|nr:pilus assembly protein PilP [Pseudomonadota bacterium]MCP4915543.1 pilus assembly protein PilP [Pseudomonadota bacterium]